jgi:hypothetical protein
MAETVNFNIDQGTTFNRRVTLTVSASDTTPINITGFTARMMIKRKKSDATAVMSLTSSDGITITGSSGRIDIALTATQTALLSGTYVYDLELITGSEVTRLFQGSITVDSEVTR